MEESAEAHMETDVSSTTEDLPETQEVTGSSGNIEMVIVVEKVIEEEINVNVQEEELSSLVDEPANEVLNTSNLQLNQPLPMDTEVEIVVSNSPIQEIVEQSPSKATTVQPPNKIIEQSPSKKIVDSPSKTAVQAPNKAAVLSPNKTVVQSPKKTAELTPQKTLVQSPNKTVEQFSSKTEINSIGKTDSPQKLVSRNLLLDTEIELSAEIQCIEDADSSMTDILPADNLDQSRSVKNSPEDVQIEVKDNSLEKGTSTPDQTELTPEQLVSTLEQMVPIPAQMSPKPPQKPSKPAQMSPKPAQMSPQSSQMPVKPIHISPIEELQINNSIVASPVKESIFVEKFTINGTVESTDTNSDAQCSKIPTDMPIDITIERETSNDSQVDSVSIETNGSEVLDREHTKGTSRELKSLIKSAKESKIISECTQVKTKTRKSRTGLDTSNTSINNSLEADKIQGVRRHSNISQKSSCSEKSEKVAIKRSMRSQNPEFVTKVKQFLNSVTGKGCKDSEEYAEDLDEKLGKEKRDKSLHKESSVSPLKRKKMESPVPDGKLRSDSYCWRCHWIVEQGAPMPCTVCPRTFHFKCLSTSERNKIDDQKSWVCPECLAILHAESSETRSQAMKKTSLGMLCDLLKYALERMMDANGVEPFMQPVDRASFPDYDKYIVHPMDLSLMQTNITDGLYGSTVAFLADAQWILHNSIIFNTLFPAVQSKLTAVARALLRSCRTEMGEIEACPECYAGAHARKPTWFTDVCTTPHILLWAKLKGFPFWPAKGMSVSSAGHVDVRFFGAHDRAWVPAKDCFLYSEKDPNNFRTKRQDIIDSMKEAEEHIRNISRKYGKFVYPAFKTQFNPSKLTEQLKLMIPSFEGEVQTPKFKSNSSPAVTKEKRKRSKSTYNDGDISENEDANEPEQSTDVGSRKMADGAEIAREEEDSNAEKPEAMDVDSTSKLNGAALPINKHGESPFPKNKHSESPLAKNKHSESPLTKSKHSKSPLAKHKHSDASLTKSKHNDSPLTKSKHSDSPLTKSKGNDPSLQKSIETPSQSNKNFESSRKRRRSALEEAVITIIESSNSTPESKRRKSMNKHEKVKKKYEEQEPSSSKEVEQKSKTIDKSKKNGEKTPSRDNEPSSSTMSDPERDKNQRVTPIRIALVQKDKHHNLRTSTAKDAMAKIINPIKQKDRDKDSDKVTPKRRHSKIDKSGDKTPKEEKLTKAEKRRNSRNKSLGGTPNSDKSRRTSGEKISEKVAKSDSEAISSFKEKSRDGKDKSKENSTTNKENHTDANNSRINAQSSSNSETESSVKDRLQFDDEISLAVIARESRTTVVSNNLTGLPTITSVRSLSTMAQNTATTSTKVTTTSISKSPDFIIATIDTSVPTPTSTEDNTSKLQRLRNNTESMVGKVGVRAFARMTSPEKPQNKNDNVEIEIKAEPIDVDDPDRQVEKLNLMNAFRLQPVNQANSTSNLREVRINKVLVTPIPAQKAPTKAIEVRARAKKTFPQPKKPEDGQLQSKNSMVYIPIQPPVTQAPVRPPRVVAGPTCPPSIAKSLISTSMSNNILVNTVSTPVMQVSAIPATTSSAVTTSSNISISSVAQVPAAVHTMPVMTSVNGQWMFSFQPVMSVGAIDNSPNPPILNGVTERSNNTPALVPFSSGTQGIQTLQVTTVTPPPTSRSNSDTGNVELPRLQQRPSVQLLNPLDPNTPIGNMPPPSTAGPLTAKLNQNAVKLADFFRTLLEDSLDKLDEPATQLTTARVQIEQMKWKHQTELKEIRHNHELTLAEIRQVCEKEKQRAIAEARRSARTELEAAVKAAKSKQWCANCSQEAQFYCCWNTSYCDYPCQRAHWSQHFNVCAQQRQDGSNSSEPPAPTETRLQAQQPDNMPKSSAAPTLTVGGKLAPSRVFSQEQHTANPQKNAIIVSMVEDSSGTQTMKCVGTYKSPTPTQNVSPIILNKQIMNNEENANKKMVSSGGYLIVGGGTNSTSVVTPTRRTHTIQYYNT